MSAGELSLCCDAILFIWLLVVMRRPRRRSVHSALLSFSTNLRGVPGMSLTINVGQTSTATLHEFTGPNGTGSELQPIGPVVFASGDPSIATVDPSTGLVTAVAAGTVSVTATDQGDNIVAQDNVTVVRGAAQSGTLTFSTPA